MGDCVNGNGGEEWNEDQTLKLKLKPTLEVNNPESRDNSIDDFNFSEFSTKGIFGPEGFLAVLEVKSSQKQTTTASSSTTKTIQINENGSRNGMCNRVPPGEEIKLPPAVSSYPDNGIKGNDETEQFEANGKCCEMLRVSETVEVNPNTSRPPEEKTFAIDHIIESIFLGLDRDTLLNCRLVCHRWAFFGSNELQKTVKLEFRHESKSPFNFIETNKFLPLEHLITVMNNSIEMSTEFPCTSFTFDDADEINPLAQSFFNTHGAHVKELTLFGDILFEDFKRLLLTQVQNLEYLKLSDSVVSKTADWNSDGSELEREGEERNGKELAKLSPCGNVYKYDDSLYNDGGGGGSGSGGDGLNSNTKPNLKNLKALYFSDSIPTKILKEILDSSPNLVEVEVENEYLHLLVKPVNRLHLLRKSKIYLTVKTLDSLEVVAKHHQGNWALRELNLRVQLNSHPHLWSRAAYVISKILKGCSVSCEKLMWGQLRFLKELQIPTMPKVRELCLHYNNIFPAGASQFFPQGVSLREIFPNLKTVFFQTTCVFNNISFTNLFDNFEPLQSATRVTFDMLYNENVLDRFREMFPNASLCNPGSRNVHDIS